MKKLLAVFAVAAIALTSAFALDLATIKGTWQDTNWDADWEFTAEGTVVLSSNGEEIITFTEDNITDFHVISNTDGVGFSFYCAKTQRRYEFTKPFTMTTDLYMSIDRDWTKEGYVVPLKVVTFLGNDVEVAEEEAPVEEVEETVEEEAPAVEETEEEAPAEEYAPVDPFAAIKAAVEEVVEATEELAETVTDAVTAEETEEVEAPAEEEAPAAEETEEAEAPVEEEAEDPFAALKAAVEEVVEATEELAETIAEEVAPEADAEAK